MELIDNAKLRMRLDMAEALLVAMCKGMRMLGVPTDDPVAVAYDASLTYLRHAGFDVDPERLKRCPVGGEDQGG